MEGLVDAIQATIADPDIEIEADNRHVYLYKRGMAQGKLSRLWLFVVVLYYGKGRASEGVVKTAFFTSKVAKDGRQTWRR